MKKTMFITSVIMVVVMAIALTTSSLAWFNAAGTSTVSTNALKLKARSVASAGLQISSASRDGAWSDAIMLDSTLATNLEPMMPLIGIGLIDPAEVEDEDIGTYLGSLNTVLDEGCSTSSFIEWVEDYNTAHTAEYSASTAADAKNSIATILAAKKKANLIEALANPDTTGTDLGFITQKIASTGKYAQLNGNTGGAVDPGRTGFFTDDLWITNTASGTASTDANSFAGKNVYVIPSITFYSSYTDAETNTPYNANTNTNDPDLFVAILADTKDTADTLYQHGSGENIIWNTVQEGANEDSEGYITDEAYLDTWEIVNIFHSKGGSTGANAAVKMGKTYNSFLSDAKISDSYYGDVAASALRATASGRNSTLLAKAAAGAAYGEAKHFRVVAWYAGDTLNNNNSGFELYFELNFEATLN